jgi:mannose-1-phosphate guanylyltransferase
VQAVILVGGEGTRLRPLTSGTPKPIVTLVDRPFIAFMLQWLARHGVDEVIMACGFLATKVKEVLGDGSRFGVKLTFFEEPEPRGTAGALKFVESDLQDRFLMLNGDVLTDVDVTAQIAQHEATDAVGTLGLVEVDDPSAYGLVLRNADNSVSGFLEKPGPEQLEGVERYYISAGIYVLERSVLDLIAPDRNVSIEREVWPALVGKGLYGYGGDGAYWLDIGTPGRYLQGMRDILSGAVETAVSASDLATGPHVRGPVMVGENVVFGPGAQVIGPAVIGAGVTLEQGAVVERSVVLGGGTLGAGAHVRDAILGPNVTLGSHTLVEGQAVLGDGVTLGANNVLARGVKLFPGTTLGDGAIKF